MTTEGIVKKKKGRLPPVPPEIFDIIGGRYKWGFKPPRGTPPELMPQNVYEFWRQNSPYELYMMQLKDYLYDLLTTEDDIRVIGETWENIGEPMSKKRIEEAQNVLNRAKAYIDFGAPVEALPYFEKVSESLGPNFQKAYEQHLQEEMDIMDEEEAREKLLGRGQALSQTGRVELEEAVKQGIVSPEEAFGPGSQWERWQHGEAGRQRPSGFDESEGAASVRYGEQSRSEQEAARQRVAEAKFYLAMMPELVANLPGVRGLQLGQDYRPSAPDVEAQPSWQDVRSFGGSSALSAEDILATQAMGYLQKPEGKQALSDYEMRMGEEFGQLYPMYKQAYLQAQQMGQTPTLPSNIEAWLGGEAPPEAKEYWKRFSGARAQRLGRRGGETIL